MLTGLLRTIALLMLAAVCCGSALAATPHADLHNTFVKLTKEKRLKIVVIGNSVSHGGPLNGVERSNYMLYVKQWLQATFPDATLDIVPSIIFAIGPEVQLFRMEEKLFAQKPDLVIVEFGAANGAWGDAGQAITDRATEGYIRRLRLMLPQADCLMNMGLFKTMLEDYQRGAVPKSVQFQHAVAQYYGCALADSEKALVDRILGGDPFETYMKDFIHPNARGYEVHGQVLAAELARQYARFQATPAAERVLRDHPLPAATLHADPWLFPRLEPALFAENMQGFTCAEQGRVKFITADTAGASGSFTPGRGRVVGILFRSPEKRGNLEVRLDGKGDWVQLSQLHEPRFTELDDSANWLQRAFFAAYGLPLYATRVDFRVAARPEAPDAYTVQIIGFFVIEHDAAIGLSRPAAPGT